MINLAVTVLILLIIYVFSCIYALYKNGQLKRSGYKGIPTAQCFNPAKHFSYAIGHIMKSASDDFIRTFYIWYFNAGPLNKELYRWGKSGPSFSLALWSKYINVREEHGYIRASFTKGFYFRATLAYLFIPKSYKLQLYLRWNNGICQNCVSEGSCTNGKCGCHPKAVMFSPFEKCPGGQYDPMVIMTDQDKKDFYSKLYTKFLFNDRRFIDE